MSQKRTPDFSDRKPILNPRRINFESEPSNVTGRILLGKQAAYKLRNASRTKSFIPYRSTAYTRLYSNAYPPSYLPRPYLPENPRQDLPAHPRPLLPAHPRPFMPAHPRPFMPAHPRPFLPAYPRPYLPEYPRPYMPAYPRPYLPAYPRPYLPGYPRPYVPPYSPAYTRPYTPAVPVVRTYSGPPRTASGYSSHSNQHNARNRIIPAMPVQTPIYSLRRSNPVPTVNLYNPMVGPVRPYNPYMPPPVLSEPPTVTIPMSPTAASTAAPSDHFFNTSFDSAFYEQTGATLPMSPPQNYRNIEEEIEEKFNTSPARPSDQFQPLDPEEYLVLPRNIFPTARMISMDPNPIIHEFCRLAGIENHSPWLLDLEFGLPREPVTRAIAVYDVQYNCINCMYTPGTIHPAFESCNVDFKNIMLNYYALITSYWHKGYMFNNRDTSVNNFQTWSQVPMQIYGMCWP